MRTNGDPVHVLLITSAYPTNAEDPRGTFIHESARALVAEGVQVTVLAPGSFLAPSTETRDGVKVQRVTYWPPRWQHLATGMAGIVPNLRRRPWLLVQVPALITALMWRAMRMRDRVDVVHAHWIYPSAVAGLLVARRRRIPLVITSHGGDMNLARRSHLLHHVSGWLSRRADACIGVSHDVVEGFKGLGVSEGKLTLLPYGVDISMVPPLEASSRASTGEAALRVVYVGGFSPRKSVETLLQAHKVLSERGIAIATVLVGAGPTEDQLRRYVSDHELRGVEFRGILPPPVARRVIRSADVLVLPSLSEGRPLVLLEALALGVPIVATDIPGSRELALSGKTGMRFPPRDHQALADCLQILMEDPSLRQRLGEGGPEFVRLEGLSLTAIAHRQRDIYNHLASTGRNML